MGLVTGPASSARYWGKTPFEECGHDLVEHEGPDPDVGLYMDVYHCLSCGAYSWGHEEQWAWDEETETAVQVGLTIRWKPGPEPTY